MEKNEELFTQFIEAVTPKILDIIQQENEIYSLSCKYDNSQIEAYPDADDICAALLDHFADGGDPSEFTIVTCLEYIDKKVD